MSKPDKPARAPESVTAPEPPTPTPTPASSPATAEGPPANEAPAAPRDPLDHDGDGKKGGAVAPAPRTHLVVLKDDAKQGLSHGEVIAAEDAAAAELLLSETARNATEQEVELARPRVRDWPA